MTTNRYASAITTPDDCKWKPQPTAWPAPRSPISSRAISKKLSMTPRVYSTPWRWRSGAGAPANPMTFSDRTGSTQGIRLRISPPAKASSSIDSSEAAATGAAALATGAAAGRGATSSTSPAASIRKRWVRGG